MENVSQYVIAQITLDMNDMIYVISDTAVAGIGKSSSNVYLSLHGALPITLDQ